MNQTTSFIPKKPLENKVESSGNQTSIFLVASVFIFIISLVITGSVYFYKSLLNKKIENMSASLEKAKAAFEPALILELKRLNSRIDASSSITAKHMAASQVFELLEGLTLKSIRFKKFGYSTASEKITISMSGEAKNYSSVALQSSILGKSSYVKDPIFSNLSLDNKGNVNFDLTANVDPSLVSYSAALERAVEQTTDDTSQ
ncbi:MAG: hypothetical protein AAB888_00235 [Patescibacteria group bacterium]